MRKFSLMVFKFVLIVFSLLVLLLLILFFTQEKFIFFPEKLEPGYTFSFSEPFSERFFTMEDGVKIHGLHFKADSAKGLVFYLHGNAGSNASWGYVADSYLKHNYDILILDYRGYGKSEGSISGEHQLYSDIQGVYDSITETEYQEKDIVILGYSIGTGMAAMIAANNKPKKLILLAPYFNLTNLAKKLFPILPGFVLKYKFKTNEFVPKTNCPIAIFHGRNDELIPSHSSEKIIELCKPDDSLFILEGIGHNGIDDNINYQIELEKFLQK